jgi:FKBP-type peptidyl-prolyl cis-trans isomerase 2
VLGSGELLPAIELGLQGMVPGEHKHITIMSSDAYGERNETLIVKYPLQQLPQQEKFSPGQQLEMKTTDGKTMHALVLAVDESSVTLDMNHPLAGKELSYELYLLSINGPGNETMQQPKMDQTNTNSQEQAK